MTSTMGTEFIRPCVKEESTEIPAIPPGFESLVSFTLKNLKDNETGSSYSACSEASISQTSQAEMEPESSKDSRITKSLRRRPSVNYGQMDNSSGEDSDSEPILHIKPQLPKGVTRGCEECSKCQKVTAKWRPEEARRPDIQDVPAFYPTEEEFEDTLNYIASIRPKAEAYGICRIVPPASWKPPCPLKEEGLWEKTKFITRIQRIDKLQNRESMMKMLKVNHYKKRRKRRCVRAGTNNGNTTGESTVPGGAGTLEAERFGFEPGPEFTLEEFQRYADDFKNQYFRKNDSPSNDHCNQEKWEPSVEKLEGEYWRIVEKPSEEIEVLYGADLETGVFGSGFPKYSHQVGSDIGMKYINTGWNLNNFPRLPGSVLSYESSDISGVLVPWLYIGMCFSSFCWHVEDHHLYSLNYMHWGAPKLWYGVPGAEAMKLETAMRKHLPDLFEEQPDLLHKLVTQLSPSILKSEGVPVCRCVQNPGEFVLTFPRAYHAGFNCGFNCAEAVNVAPVDWLPHGLNAIELYREQGRKTSISHDKLLLGAAREAVKAHWELDLLKRNTSNNLRWRDFCGKDGILSKALKTRVEMERVRREFLCNSSPALKMETTFDATCERECSVCLFDLHLSAAGCHQCSPDKYACLNHAKQLCPCSWGSKFFLYRYDINELNVLVEALEGKLSAIYRWARSDLGLALISYVSKAKSEVPSGQLSHPPEESARGMSSQPVLPFAKEQKEKEHQEILNYGKVNMTSSLQKEKVSGELSALDNPRASSKEPHSSHEVKSTIYIQSVKERSLQPAPHLRVAANQLGLSSSAILALGKPELKKTSSAGSDGVILLSDDEEEESSIPLRKSAKDSKENLEMKLVTKNEVLVSASPVKSSSVPSEKIESSTNLGLEVEACAKGVGLASSYSCDGVSSSDKDAGKIAERLSNTEETAGCDTGAQDSCFQHPQSLDSEKVKKEDMKEDSHIKLETDGNLMPMNNAQCNRIDTHNNLDRCFRQKGPRIAKVVRRINCNVEPLEYGVVQSGKSWCDSQAIYPKGFRSRVKYIDVLDPSNTCYYVSEILETRRDGPLFMVSLEHHPNEVFVHVSPNRCWEMIRERVNQEIIKQHKLGRQKLSPLQPPGSLDGMEMFGFSSPTIVQAIQAMDQGQACTEYWKSRPLMQLPQCLQAGKNSSDVSPKPEIPINMQRSRSHSAGVDTIIQGLLKKANPDELQALYSIITDDNSGTDKGLLSRLLNDEISKCQR